VITVRVGLVVIVDIKLDVVDGTRIFVGLITSYL